MLVCLFHNVSVVRLQAFVQNALSEAMRTTSGWRRLGGFADFAESDVISKISEVENAVRNVGRAFPSHSQRQKHVVGLAAAGARHKPDLAQHMGMSPKYVPRCKACSPEFTGELTVGTLRGSLRS